MLATLAQTTVKLDAAWTYGAMAYIVAAVGWAIRLEVKLAKFEQWRTERVQPIEDYYRDRQSVDSRLAVLEAGMVDIKASIARIELKLDAQVRA